MHWLIASCGILIAGFGIFGLLSPARFCLWLQRFWGSLSGFYLAMGLRVLIGVSLLLAASATHFPMLMKILGALTLIGAAVLPILGLQRFQRIIRWLTQQPHYLLRSWSLIACAFGTFLIYAVW